MSTPRERRARSDPDGRGSDRYRRIYALVRTIPTGEVATYGQVAFVAELATPRIVGYALAGLPVRPPGGPVPWHRVVNAQGRISPRREGDADARQRAALAAEGVPFDARGRVDFRTAGWRGPDWEWLEANGYDVGSLIARAAHLPRSGPWSRWTL